MLPPQEFQVSEVWIIVAACDHQPLKSGCPNFKSQLWLPQQSQPAHQDISMSHMLQCQSFIRVLGAVILLNPLALLKVAGALP